MARRSEDDRPFPRRMIIHLEATLAAGLLVILPLFITIWILKFIFDLVDPVILTILFISLTIPPPRASGVALCLVLICGVLVTTTHGLGQRMINGVHWLVERVPGIGSIYSPLRSAMQTLSRGDDRPYRGVVLVEFPRQGSKSIGLITSYLGETDGEDMLAVYVPTTPVPSSGFLIVVPYTDVTFTDISVDDAMKIIISGGLLAGSLLGESNVEAPVLSERDHD
ncbi:MAG: DUF502 domain-containing protein [Chloroflexi bacterium]|nr:DUF502 domain-containing protein [Chloroflexota bacterium]